MFFGPHTVERDEAIVASSDENTARATGDPATAEERSEH
jgi:hypothetical protein